MSETIGGVSVEQAIDDGQAREALSRALELTDATVVDFTALNRRDYLSDGRRLPGGALVVDCAVTAHDGSRQHRRVEVDETRRPMSEAVITYLGGRAQSADNRGEFIWNTVSLK